MMKIRKSRAIVAVSWLAVGLICLWAGAALANPAFPGGLEVLDGTGNPLVLRTYGDEFFSYTATMDGDLVWRDGWGSYHYIVEQNGAYALGELVFPATPRFLRTLPGMSSAADNETRVNVNAAGEDFKEKLEAFYTARKSGIVLFSLRSSGSPLDGYTPAQGVDPLCGKWVEVGKGFTQPTSPARGSVCPLLILKIQYADTYNAFTDQEWHDRIFGDKGVTAYYNEVSNNRFTYVPARESSGKANDGVITVTLPIRQPVMENQFTGHNYDRGAKADLYTSTDGLHKYAIYGNASLYAYGLEAANAYIDFSQYDKQHDSFYNGNNDGYISPTELAVLVVNAGYEASFCLSGAGDPATWASSWFANNWWMPEESTGEIIGTEGGVLLDGVQLYKYTILGENLNGPPSATNYRPYDVTWTRAQNQAMGYTPYQIEIGTACHELGHDLGLQDLYDTSAAPANEQNVGTLSLMAGGSWGVAPEDFYNERFGSSPSHLDAYSKLRLGFFQAQTVSASGAYPVVHASDSAHYNILRVNTDNPDVYYLVENRTFSGFDKGMYFDLDIPGGAVYWRIDEAVVRDRYAANKVNNTPGPYGVVPVYVYYAYYNTCWWCRPFRNSATYNAYPTQRVFTLPEKQSVSLLCYDVTAPVMNVWLNASSPLRLTLSPGGAFPEGQAAELTAVLGAGSYVTLTDLASVAMDGISLAAPGQYEARAGSIILTLKKDYLNTLALGSHTLRVTLTNGLYVETQLLVYKEVPVTGDASTPWLWAILGLLSAAGLIALPLQKRKETV